MTLWVLMREVTVLYIGTQARGADKITQGEGNVSKETQENRKHARTLSLGLIRKEIKTGGS